MLLVATMSNSIFALDADGPLPERSGVLWQRKLGSAPAMEGNVWKNCAASHCLAPIGHNIRGSAGIGSTPVIDRLRGIIFVVDRVLTGQGIDVEYRLHALDLHDGHDLAGSPSRIAGSSLGVTFNPNWQNQRAGLAMSRGQIIIGFGAYEDLLAYRGWLFSYRYDSGTGFVQSATMTTTPDGDVSDSCAEPKSTPISIAARTALEAATAKLALDIVTNPTHVPSDLIALEAAQLAYNTAAAPEILMAANTCAHGGVWMTGRAPAVDANGRVLLMVGNGRNDMGFAPNRNFGNSLLVLDPASLQVLDSFTPADHVAINAWDLDLGGSGPLIIPGSNLVVGGGKQGIMYVWNLNRLGGFTLDDSGAVQKFPAGIVELHFDTGLDNPGGVIRIDKLLNNIFNLNTHAGHIMGGPVYWQRGTQEGGSRLYNWSENSELRMYAVDESSTQPVQVPEMAKSTFVQAGHPGGILTLSATGATPGSGIIWASTYDAAGTHTPLLGTTGALTKVVRGILRAYSADTLKLLWTSTDNAVRDDYGMLAKFNPPTVANGRVYVATFSNRIVAFGLHKHKYSRPAMAIGSILNGILNED